MMRSVLREDLHRLRTDDQAAGANEPRRKRQRIRAKRAPAIVQEMVEHEAGATDARAKRDPVDEKYRGIDRDDGAEAGETEGAVAHERRIDPMRASPFDQRSLGGDHRVGKRSQVSPFDLPALGVALVAPEAVMTKMDRPMLAIAQTERRVEHHRQAVERRHVAGVTHMQKLVQAERETNVDPGHRDEQCPHRDRIEKRGRENGVHREGVREGQSQVAPGIGVIAQRAHARR